jgi:hypothetical protein
MSKPKKITLSSAQLAANQAVIDADKQAILTQKFTYDDAVNKVSALKDKLYNQNKYMASTYSSYLALLHQYNVQEPVNNPKGTVDVTTLSSTIQTQIRNAYTLFQNVVAEVKQTGDDLKAADQAQVAAKKTLDADKAALAAAIKGKANQQLSKDNTTGAPPPLKGDPKAYTYNAPMTSSSYLKFGPQVFASKNDRLITSPGAWTNAKSAWKPDPNTGAFTGAKGAIQMSQDLASDISANTHGTGKNPATGLKNDVNPYGFKFLYNPTSVGMSWGIVESFSPQFEQSGQDIATAVGNGLLASTVTFSLILNRIEDMSYIKNSSGEFITNNSSPYPYTVAPSERGLIYDRGTMYDLEYLFRATGGYNSQYISSVGGITTADKGWLMPMPVELHLGANLRYLVRVSSLDINHAIFNERMVPVFTTINMTCTRYYDDLSITASNIVKATS